MAEDMNLNSANAKQKVKIYKAVIKEIKSKEIEIKLGALQRFKDCRYLTEGGSMTPLLDSVTVKKKTIDFSKTALDFFTSFLDASDPALGGPAATVQAIKTVFDREGGGDLLPVRSLVDAMIFKEEVKKVKIKSPVKGQPAVFAEDPPEREVVLAIRTKALKSLHGIIRVLTNPQLMPPDNDSTLITAVASIPGIEKNIIWVLNSVLQRYEKGVNDACLQEGCWALTSACSIFKFSPANISSALTLGLVGTVAALSVEKAFVSSCCQIFEILSRHSEGLLAIAVPDCLNAVVSATEMCSEALFAANAATAAAAGGKDGKKGAAAPSEKAPPKKGGKEAPAAPATTEPKFVQEDPNRLMVIGLRASSIALSHIAQGPPDCYENLSEEYAGRVASSVCKVLTNQLVWQICKSPLSDPFDYPIIDSMNYFARVLADLAVINPPLRRAICQTEAISGLLSALQTSSAIVGPSEDGIDTADQLLALRRVLERSLLCLFTDAKKSTNDAGEKPIGSPVFGYSEAATDALEIKIPSSGQYRWNSCRGYTTDMNLFPSSPVAPPVEAAATGKGGKAAPKEPEVPAANRGPMPAIMGLILSDDASLANHGWRIMYSLQQGSNDQTLFAVNNSIDAGFIAKSAKCFQARLQSVLEDMLAKKAASAADVGGLESQESYPSEQSELGEPVGEDKVPSTQVIVDPVVSAQAIPPSHEAALFCACGVLEIALNLTAEAVNAFASKETIQLLSKLLYAGGPVCSSINEQSNFSSEYLVTLLDLRRFFWDPRPEERMQDNVQLRPLLIDVLAIAAAAHSKYVTFESSAPPAACQPLSASVSPCREASMLVAKYCGDALCSMLMTKAAFATSGEGKNVVVVPNWTCQVLHVDIADAALRCIQKIATGNADSLYGLLEGIAESGLSSSRNKNASLCSLQNFLINLESNAASNFSDPTPVSSHLDAVTDGINSLAIEGRSPLKAVGNSITSDFMWSRAQYFDQIYGGNGILTTLSSIQNNRSLWPYVSLCAAIVGIIGNPLESSTTNALAIQAIKSLCSTNIFQEFNQPVCFDVMCAVLLSVGGIIPIFSALGRYGNIKDKVSDEDFDGMVMFIRYLLSRGKCREVFWSDWAKAEAAKVEIDPKTGKPIVAKGGKDKGKDKKPAADKGKKGGKGDASAVVSCVADCQYNDEPDETNSDPNHGPATALWTNLLRVHNDDYHSNSRSSSPLTTVVQCMLPEFVEDLLSLGADVNSADARGVTPLMYSLVLDDLASIQKCLEAGADVDAIDKNGNPVIKYASLVLSPDDIQQQLVGYTPVFTSPSLSFNDIALLGKASSAVAILIQFGIDVNVCDSDGNNSLLCFLGLAKAKIVLGGYILAVSNAAYDTSKFYESPLDTISFLLAAGANVDFCNRQGVVPLHVAAARGDKGLISTLMDSNCIRNPLDAQGFLPIHYAASACPVCAPEVISSLLELSQDRPAQRLEFKDLRTGKSKEQKFALDALEVTNSIFEEALIPASLRQRRLSAIELLLTRVDSGTNIVQLVMSAHTLPFENVAVYCIGTKEERMQLTMSLILTAGPRAPELVCNVDSNNMNALHAASRMLSGVTPQRELTAAELRSKRYKAYPSIELQIMDIIFMNIPNIDVNSWCSWPTPWTALQAAVQFDNVDLAKTLIARGADLDGSQKLIHLLASTNTVSSETAQYIVNLCANTSNYNYFINTPDYIDGDQDAARPIHLAVRCGSTTALDALLQCPKCDVNARDEVTGMTAIHEACQGELVDVLRVFAGHSDRIDLLVRCLVDSTTCVDAAMELYNTAVLNELISMRRNDVVEWVLTVRENGTSWLEEVERENMQNAMNLGYVDPDTIVVSNESIAEDNVSIGADQEADRNIGASYSPDHSRSASPALEDSDVESSVERGRSSQSPMLRAASNTSVGAAGLLAARRLQFDNEAGMQSHPPQPQRRPTTGTTPIHDVLQNDVMVRMLIKAVNDAGFTSSEAHAHKCFALGQTFTEYCSRRNVST